MRKSVKLIAGGVAAAAVVAGGAVGVNAARDTTHPAEVSAASGARTPATAPAALAVPSSASVKIKAQYQKTGYYCVPASGAMSLSTFGIKVSQKTLAKKMGTTKNGTSGTKATPVLNKYVKSRGYSYTVVKDVNNSPSTLMKRVSYDIGVLKKAPTIAVWMEKLPWNKGTSGSRIGHAIVAYGYNKKKGTITVWDPWKKTGGKHTISAKTLSKTLQGTGGMRYISKH